jgi:rRNA-processing protein FCF1
MNKEYIEEAIYERTQEFVPQCVYEAILELIASEREACAKLLEEAAQAAKDVDPQGFVWIAIKTSAEGIRARGQA